MDVKSLEVLHTMGILLAEEADWDRFLEILLKGAKGLTHAEGGILYKVVDGCLEFFLIQTSSMRVVAEPGPDKLLPCLPLFDGSGDPRRELATAFAVVNETTLNIPDIYENEIFDFSALREFDVKSGFRTRSLLLVPVRDHENRVTAVLQLINARGGQGGGDVVPFSREDQWLVESLAKQASVAREAHQLRRHHSGSGKGVMVHGTDGSHPLPVTRLQRNLQACGLSRRLSREVTAVVHLTLAEEEQWDIGEADLVRLVCRLLAADVSRQAAEGFAAWELFRLSGLPLIVLIGGAASVGKGSIAAELAQRLGMERIHATATLREGLRVLLSRKEHPLLHASLVDAWKLLPHRPRDRVTSERLFEGCLAHLAQVEPMIEGVVRRTAREKEWALVEGIHVDPAFAGRFPADWKAVVVPVVLATPDKEALVHQMLEMGEERGWAAQSGFSQKAKGVVWELQARLIARAREHRVTVLPNIRKELTVRQVLEVVTERLVHRFHKHIEEYL